MTDHSSISSPSVSDSVHPDTSILNQGQINAVRDVNTFKVGESAQVDQLAVGTNIQLVKYVGYTVDQISVLLAEIRITYQVKPLDGRSPYVGLASFREQVADCFFGRQDLIAELPPARTEGSGNLYCRPVGQRQIVTVACRVAPYAEKGAGVGKRTRKWTCDSGVCYWANW